MTGDVYEAVVLLARLAFAALLYIFVAAALWLMWRDVRRRATGPAPPPSYPSVSPRLTLEQGPGDAGLAERSVALRDGLVFGRRPPSDVVLTDDFMSGQHARIRFAEGQWWLEDLGSTNGTYLNGQRIDRRAPLAHDSTVTMGQTVWRVECEP